MKYKEGDKVVLIDESHQNESGRWHGTVTKIHPLSFTGWNYSVKWDSGVTELVNEEELQAADQS